MWQVHENVQKELEKSLSISTFVVSVFRVSSRRFNDQALCPVSGWWCANDGACVVTRCQESHRVLNTVTGDGRQKKKKRVRGEKPTEKMCSNVLLWTLLRSRIGRVSKRHTQCVPILKNLCGFHCKGEELALVFLRCRRGETFCGPESVQENYCPELRILLRLSHVWRRCNAPISTAWWTRFCSNKMSERL